MTTLISPSALQSAIASITTAQGYIGRSISDGQPAVWASSAQSALGLALARFTPGMRNQLTAQATLTASATAFTTAAGELTGANATAATAAATIATAAAAAIGTEIATIYTLGGEVAMATGFLNQVASALSSGAALTAINAALSSLSGVVS